MGKEENKKMVHIKSEKGCLKIIQTPLYYYI